MDTDNKPIINEEIVIKGQRIASIAAFVLFILADSISVKVFGVEKYGVLGICIPMFYLGASSIKNRVSIVRLKGQKGYSRDTRAVVFGIIMVVIALGYIFILFIPFLSERLLPF
ncbi:MAG: hypothetical protein WCA79_13765 [Anaerolineales bacterium]